MNKKSALQSGFFVVYLRRQSMVGKATIFEFTSYKFSAEGGSASGGEPQGMVILFNYKTKFKGKLPLFFTETVILPRTPDIKNIPPKLLSKLLECLHIMLGISYYKLYCAAKIKLPYKLSKREADFWNIVYQKGLGEFFYRNNLDPKISPKFFYTKNYNPKAISHPLRRSLSEASKPKAKSLVGIGGGKDSIVAAELLKRGDFNITALAIQTNKRSGLTNAIIKKIGVGDLKIKRVLDQKVFEKHQYNGHIPISAIYAFLGILAAVLYKYSYFIVGNEYSSNFGNLKYKGMEVNHQWSKSFEFEKLFQDYVKNFISPDIFYFSLLRPFYEIRIAKLFSKLGKKYFSYFSSCNKNFKITGKQNSGLWCCNCHKCIFVFVLSSAFLTKNELLKIFGRNLYEDKNLLPLFKDILGIGKAKPFDCVGTFQEARVAFVMAEEKFKNYHIVKIIKETHYDILQNIRVKDVFKTQVENAVPEQFRFLGLESALILGYGKEGRVSKKYLKKIYPNLKIGTADQKRGSGYLKKQDEFDIAIKTPGIKKELLTIPYTTATNIFFSQVKGKNAIIGVTGSKGKSTTASLIFEILKAGKKDVELLGNIGKPMLEGLLKPTGKFKTFVLELSSYQLDDAKFSPDIAVVTNLFPEHMDYHNNVRNYYQAKKNIINFQSSNDCFVCNSKNKIIKSWLKSYKGNIIPFLKSNLKSQLAGEHNQENIGAAVAVAKLLKIPDETIKRAAEDFKGLPHRLEFVGQFKGIKFYDDAISTTPESTIIAIKSLKNIDTIFLGGQDRGYDFSQLEKTIKKYKIKNIVLFPDSGQKMLKSKKGLNVLNTSSMKKAVEFSYKNTKRGRICLLSCASPSYSIWKNFEEKGKQFQYFVKKLSK